MRDALLLTVYVAGPISGRHNENREAFERARRLLEENPNVKAVTPHDIYQADDFAARCPALVWCQAMCVCIPMVGAADYVYFLDGWQHSRGACREWLEAYARGKRRLYEDVA